VTFATLWPSGSRHDEVHVIIAEGAGWLCAGWRDLNEYAVKGAIPATSPADHPACRQENTCWDPMVDYMRHETPHEEFMSPCGAAPSPRGTLAYAWLRAAGGRHFVPCCD
jgi:hypothetical protein